MRRFYQATWPPFSNATRLVRPATAREFVLSFYGPMSIIVLVVFWVAMLIVGFAMLHYAIGTDLSTPDNSYDFGDDLYYSGTTFFTLGLGDITPTAAGPKILTIVEAGMGFGFLALIIGYLPVLYQSFSARESVISLLDARAGSPPRAAELFRRLPEDDHVGPLTDFLSQAERWSSEMLETHLSYPMLVFFRSQHDGHSWLAALTSVLDVCALIMACGPGPTAHRARLTFTVAGRTAINLSELFHRRVRDGVLYRISAREASELADLLEARGMLHVSREQFDRSLHEFRAMYEPHVGALAEFLRIDLPPWNIADETDDDWLAGSSI